MQSANVSVHRLLPGLVLASMKSVRHAPLTAAPGFASSPSAPRAHRQARTHAVASAEEAHVWTNTERYQEPLTSSAKKEKRAYSQRLGKDLCVVNIGHKGLTLPVIYGLSDALQSNELVKVRVGGDEDVRALAAQLEEVTDSIAVHKIGSTLTLYRDRRLPRPAITLSDDRQRALARADAPQPATQNRAPPRRDQTARAGPPLSSPEPEAASGAGGVRGRGTATRRDRFMPGVHASASAGRDGRGFYEDDDADADEFEEDSSDEEMDFDGPSPSSRSGGASRGLPADDEFEEYFPFELGANGVAVPREVSGDAKRGPTPKKAKKVRKPRKPQAHSLTTIRNKPPEFTVL